jgi:hypothetical protein
VFISFFIAAKLRAVEERFLRACDIVLLRECWIVSLGCLVAAGARQGRRREDTSAATGTVILLIVLIVIW